MRSGMREHAGSRGGGEGRGGELQWKGTDIRGWIYSGSRYLCCQAIRNFAPNLHYVSNAAATRRHALAAAYARSHPHIRDFHPPTPHPTNSLEQLSSQNARCLFYKFKDSPK